VSVQRFLSCLHKTKYEFPIPTAFHIRIFAFHKNGLIEICLSLNICQHTKFYDTTLTGANFASISEVWTSVILEWLKILNYRLWRPGQLQWQDLPAEFNESLSIGLKVIRDTYTQTALWSHKIHFPFWGKWDNRWNRGVKERERGQKVANEWERGNRQI
jgi:hypothetical protein